MPPVVQMHQMVQPPHDPFGSLPVHYNPPEYQVLPRRRLSRPTPSPFAVDTIPRDFPNPQAPTLQRISTSFVRSHAYDHSPEHGLRRKTPNGTIDNGYDGSVAHLASGPPPLKHMKYLAPSSIFPTAVVHRPAASSPSNLRQPPAGSWPFPPTVPTGNVDVGPGALSSPSQPLLQGGAWPVGPSNNVVMDPLMHPVAQHGYHAETSLQPLLGPGYHQPLPQPVFNPLGFQQPSPWGCGGLAEYRASVPLANGYSPQNAVVDSAFMPAQPTMHPGIPNAPGLGQPHQYRLPLASHPLDDGFNRYGQHHVPRATRHSMDNISPNTAQGFLAGAAPSQAHFKQRALQQAHKAYSDLLAYLGQAKKMQSGRNGSGSRSSSKMVVYPKPSTTAAASLGVMSARPSHGYPDLSHRYGHGVHSGAYMGSPAIMAKSSLDVLSGLCEQSGWKWVDGMLLGGCLHYGLEHFEEALEWFRRIVNLNPNHVEAISNIAATLYCLNRHSEAEQHWMRAVKQRPSYLEAVEHLVGLLCSDSRGQEAADTIDFVQHALRIPPPGTAHEHASETASETDAASSVTAGDSSPDGYVLDSGRNDSPEQRFVNAAGSDATRAPGFGSSGYAIPGSENGRMILLIHAKGNMLYALKRIERASEAFEEAVLISAGRQVRGIQSLIRKIQTVLAPAETQPGHHRTGPRNLSAPLLLPPEKAKNTAQQVFRASGGLLPGLRYVPDGSHRKSAVATTSNSLLSLAKIFQDAMSNGGPHTGLTRQPAGVGEILALYYLSLSLQESPSTANNVGILLASVQPSSTQHVTGTEAAVAAQIPGIVPGSGLALALSYYNYGLTLDPKHVHLHTNLGSLLKDIGQLDMAINMYEQAVACDGTFDIALTNLANAVKDRGRISDAITYYRRAVHANPEFAEAVCGLSTALNSVCDWKGRGGVLLANGKYDRWHVDANGMLQDVRASGQSGGLMKRVVAIVGRQLKESSSWGCGTLQEPSTMMQLVAQLRDAGASTTDPSLDLSAELQRWSGKPWEGSRILRLIERSMRSAMRSWYLDKYVRGTKTPTRYTRVRPPSSLSVPSAPTVLPFHTFTCPLTAKDIRMISQRNALRISCSTLRSSWMPATVYEPPAPPSPFLKVGYVSSDFNNHPLAHLMQSVFGFHDQRRVQAFCYATTSSDRSIHRQQIEREAPVFRDVSTWTSDKLVEQIVADGIHILVNLNGYTRGARNEIFAARPAPIQMSFMGFAGTLGAEWCDYLLADATAIPPSTLRPHRSNLSLGDVFRDEADVEAEDWVYSENIVFCRDTFFCCDHAQSADGHDERGITWEEDQKRRWKMRKELFPSLPDDAIILGNFNQLYKIDPTTFRCWLRILAGSPKAYLWLLRFPELGENNLRQTAKLWGGEGVANRIIFTDVAPKQQHISRARICDLFLDTPECNAHTTAADILWSSTPLVTLPRYEYKMCSRMAASILKGALPKGPEGEKAAQELIADGEEEYEDFAQKLVNGMRYRIVTAPDGTMYGEGLGRLAELRRILWKSKWTCALFDTRRWVRDLEEAYEVAWQRWVDGVGGDIYL